MLHDVPVPSEPGGSSDPIGQTVPLDLHWPTIDPFLFCAHHLDRYPAGNERLGPAASLAGRRLGQDFAGIDGWRMYHGQVVPGFPQHPHRGFETITFVRRGLIDHSDSMGATARFGRGDVQWLTAGRGVVHSEMFPLLDPDDDNPLELFQIWLNLPAQDKLVEPYFTMSWDAEIPHRSIVDEAGHVTRVTVIAGRLPGPEAADPPAPPPHSWASHPEADVAIWHLALDPDATWSLPPAAGPDTVRTLYLFEGSALIGTHRLETNTGAVVAAGEALAIAAGASGAECLILQGRPIGEPVAQSGPFVMNTDAEIRQAFADYRATGFGGWPFPSDDPVHPRGQGRFARHADGRVESAPG